MEIENYDSLAPVVASKVSVDFPVVIIRMYWIVANPSNYDESFSFDVMPFDASATFWSVNMHCHI